MQKVIALGFFLASMALAACGAPPVHSLDNEQNHTASSRIGSGCTSLVLMPEAKNACGLTVASSFSGTAQLSISANGPDVWTGPLTVELYDADRGFAGPLCTLVFSANGSQSCGTFALSDHDTLGVNVTLSDHGPTGVRLTLESVGE